MRRSLINRAYCEALDCFQRHHWVLPPQPQWEITDFGLGDFAHHGLVLVSLAAEPEYGEKLMWARRGQSTPCHTHARKKEDLICRAGELAVTLWAHRPTPRAPQPARVRVAVNGVATEVATGQPFLLAAGWRMTLRTGVWHEFHPVSDECIIGEVSTAADDAHDNFFHDSNVGRFLGIEEDEPALVHLGVETAGPATSV